MFIVALILIASLGCILYPSIAQWWNKDKKTRGFADYNDIVSNLSDDEINSILSAADAYNQNLLNIQFPMSNPEAEVGYKDLLSVGNDDAMGYLEVPVLNDLKLPIYHYTSDESMSKGAGHMLGSSLPVGGESTHAVLSAHCGLPNEELFTHLEWMKEGDIFTITVLNRKLTYQVDQIKTVLPDDDDDIQIVPGQDYVTLLTCTPFGINTHRLLVRGTRIPNLTDESQVPTHPVGTSFTWQGIWKAMDPRLRIVVMFMAGTLVIVIFIKIVQAIQYHHEKKKKEKERRLAEQEQHGQGT